MNPRAPGVPHCSSSLNLEAVAKSTVPFCSCLSPGASWPCISRRSHSLFGRGLTSCLILFPVIAGSRPSQPAVTVLMGIKRAFCTEPDTLTQDFPVLPVAYGWMWLQSRGWAVSCASGGCGPSTALWAAACRSSRWADTNADLPGSFDWHLDSFIYFFGQCRGVMHLFCEFPIRSPEKGSRPIQLLRIATSPGQCPLCEGRLLAVPCLRCPPRVLCPHGHALLGLEGTTYQAGYEERYRDSGRHSPPAPSSVSGDTKQGSCWLNAKADSGGSRGRGRARPGTEPGTAQASPLPPAILRPSR